MSVSKRIFGGLLYLPFVILIPFWVWFLVPLVRLVPWWGLLGICYFFASQGVEEIVEYRKLRDQAILHGDRSAVALVPLEQFNPDLHVGENREVYLAAKRLDAGAPLTLRAEKYLKYAIIPLAGASGDIVRGVAVVSSPDGNTLQAYMERRQGSAGQFEINGQYDPPTPWLSESGIRKTLEGDGYVLHSDLILVAPYIGGRMTKMLSDAGGRWFWISFIFSLSAVSGLGGLWKLRRWLVRLGASGQ